MTPASKKQKGRLHQQWVRDLIYRLWPGLEAGDVRSTSMGAGGEDLQLSPAARRVCPVSIECKSIAKFAGYKFLDQATENCVDNAQPIAVVKANQRQPIVLVDAEYFFKLLRGK